MFSYGRLSLVVQPRHMSCCCLLWFLSQMFIAVVRDYLALCLVGFYSMLINRLVDILTLLFVSMARRRVLDVCVLACFLQEW